MNEPNSDGSDGFIVQRPAAVSDRHVEGLADVLIDCVDGGASVSFMHPLPRAKALEFWRGVADGVAHGERALCAVDARRGLIQTIPTINMLKIDLSQCAEFVGGGRETLTNGLATQVESLRIEAAHFADHLDMLGYGVAHAAADDRTDIRCR